MEQAQWQDEHRDDQHDNYDCGATATTMLVCVRANRVEGRARGILGLLASICTNLPSHQPCATSQLDSQEIDSTTDSNNPRHVTLFIAQVMPSHTSQRKHTLRSMDQRPGFQEAILHGVYHDPPQSQSRSSPQAHYYILENTTDMAFQDPRAASPSGKKSSRATSPTQMPRTTAARRNAFPCLRTITSACTTRRR